MSERKLAQAAVVLVAFPFWQGGRSDPNFSEVYLIDDHSEFSRSYSDVDMAIVTQAGLSRRRSIVC